MLLSQYLLSVEGANQGAVSRCNAGGPSQQLIFFGPNYLYDLWSVNSQTKALAFSKGNSKRRT